MPSHSRRAFLEFLVAGATATLAGCQIVAPTEPPTDGSTPTTSLTETPTPTAGATPSDIKCDAAPRPETAWPVPRRSPARDSYVDDPDGFETAPTLAWDAEPSQHGDPHAFASYGRPVVVGDTVYLTNRLDKGPERPMYGHVHALAAGNGDRRWTSERLRSPSHPVIWGDLAIVTAENESSDTMVVAFDRADGTRQWAREFGARDGGRLTVGDHLYLALEEPSDRGTLWALAVDGSTVWRREGAFADHVNEGPAVGSDRMFVTTRTGRLHALARDDGTTVWTHRFEHPTAEQPYVTDLVATDCAVFAVVEGAVTALDDGGTPVWAVGGDYGSLATDGEAIYTATGVDDEREFQELDAATGEVSWTVGAPVLTYEPSIVAGDTVYVSLDETLVALDRADGTEHWRTDDSLDSLALADGMLYGITGDSLRCFKESV